MMDGDTTTIVPGGSLEVSVAFDDIGRATVHVEKDQILHKGDKLSMISAAIKIGNEWVLGSPFMDGLLVC